MGRFHSKVIYQKCVFFTNTGNDYSLKDDRKKNLKIFFRFCIEYESNKYMFRILFKKKIRRAHDTSCNSKLVIYLTTS